MKPTLHYPLIFLYLVLAAVSAPNAVRGEQVLDTSGNPLESGVQYYIIPADGGSGGGLVPSSRTFNIQKLCPLDVVQSPLNFIPGLPVTFTPQDSAQEIQVNGNVNVQFETSAWLCPQSKVWKWDHDNEAGLSFISTGGAIGDAKSWFKIRAVGDNIYRFSWCNNGDVSCDYVSIYSDNFGVRRLIIGNTIFLVKFQKVSQANIASEKTMLKMFPPTM